ncbi:PQQ-binding-like beta-propeller repeat protein [Fimbriiglobus ruber]|uniref:Pyrrolo-quinoline quinone repeat domain-containing protein n=1 Tax=Fimbriiglobus ruber TaxID=1908690 RepID=A0A225CZQ1_9BACT|nr:PQQ-binding-like beta-propeller repeat protein [Fimbriiglobus ruber]OWK34830.1 hypothetical protein FRUB_09672 [Fimbriiglobus ruber]
MRIAVAILTTIALVAPAVRAADWPQFRGANGAAVSTETGLPTGFTEKEGLRWKVTLPGRGIGSPVVVGGRVYATASSGARDDRLHVFAFDAGTGAKLWHRQLQATGSTAAHPTTCMAAPTPVADETGVYTLFATGDLAAFDADGNLRWYRSLVSDYPTVSNQVGMASSPVLVRDKLIVPMDNAGESFLAAIDTKTGKNVWKTPRSRDINWVTPVVRTVNGKTEVLYPGAKELAAYNVETGAKTWAAKTGGSIPSPTLVEDEILVPGGGVSLAKLGTGGLKEQWKSNRLQTGMSSPLYYEGHVYAAAPAGVVVCADAKTGKQVWDVRLKGPFSGSPVAGDGKIYLVNEAGVLYVLKAGGDSAEILAESQTKDKGQATPAISGGAIFIRGEKTLFCVGPKYGS